MNDPARECEYFATSRRFPHKFSGAILLPFNAIQSRKWGAVSTMQVYESQKKKTFKQTFTLFNIYIEKDS